MPPKHRPKAVSPTPQEQIRARILEAALGRGQKLYPDCVRYEYEEHGDGTITCVRCGAQTPESNDVFFLCQPCSDHLD
jgi:hypothetical protein